MTLHDDLKAISGSADSFFTVAIPSPSDQANAEHRFELEWRNARRRLSSEWSEEELAPVDQIVSELSHGSGAALVLVHARNGATLAEFIDEPIGEVMVHEGPLPRLAPLIEARQRTIAHVVVETDRAGADLTAFDGGAVLATESVDGDTEHIHRGAPGGWSQRRFQQRAENTWEANARDVADEVAELTRRIDARLVAVAGDVRAQGFVLEHLPADVSQLAVKIEAGSPDGIAAEVVRLVSSLVAEDVSELADRVRSNLGHGTASTEAPAILGALDEGRVDTLLVHDDGSDDPVVGPDGPGRPVGARVIDAAIVGALNTDARVVVVPKLALLDGPIAALLRW